MLLPDSICNSLSSTAERYSPSFEHNKICFDFMSVFFFLTASHRKRKRKEGSIFSLSSPLKIVNLYIQVLFLKYFLTNWTNIQGAASGLLWDSLERVGIRGTLWKEFMGTYTSSWQLLHLYPVTSHKGINNRKRWKIMRAI